jgi:hypothetical protein
MQLVKAYPPQVKEWKHMAKEHFAPEIEEPAEQYTLEITPSDPTDKDFVYFNVSIEKKLVNIPHRSKPFTATIYYHFKVKTNHEIPTAEFYFSLIETAASSFAIYFYENVKKTNLKGHKIHKPSFKLLQDDIQKAINNWKRLNNGMQYK